MQSPKFTRSSFAHHLAKTRCTDGTLKSTAECNVSFSVALVPKPTRRTIKNQIMTNFSTAMGKFSSGSAPACSGFGPRCKAPEELNNSKSFRGCHGVAHEFGLLESPEGCGTTAISGTWKVVPHLASLRGGSILPAWSNKSPNTTESIDLLGSISAVLQVENIVAQHASVYMPQCSESLSDIFSGARPSKAG